MKSKITLSLLLLASAGAMAQQIATFEDGFTPSIPVTIVGAAEGSGEQSVFQTDATNPNSTGLNTSEKCLYILSNQVQSDDVSSTSPGRPTWAGNTFSVLFENAVDVTDANRYLHILHLKERTMNAWLIWGISESGTEVELGRGNCPEAGEWFDITVDIKAKLPKIKGFKIVLDANWSGGPERFYDPCKFYYDDIVMNGDIFPRGTVLLTRQNLLDFEDQNVTNATVSFSKQKPGYLNDGFYENSLITGVNTSFRSACYSPNTEEPVWWHGFYFTFKNLIDTRDYEYMHMMMRKDAEESQIVQVTLGDLNSVQSGNLVDAPVTTEWVDYVFRIPATHVYIKDMYVKFNAGAQPTKCFIDQIWMDNDPTPRAGIVSALNVAEFETDYAVEEGTVVILKESANIRIYTTWGAQVYSGYEKRISLDRGIYILTIDGKSHKVIIK